ncbi:NADH-quinone oxidoreductase subunit L [Pontibacillus sp. HMF3514]|uniref:NADH-quinone oxidoreductase subunit L n=1 Tax=Pontibacillus sp. HMF3514 TaxID=2692425 RepID=UPI00131F57AA|nr:NADH-quinone oxidoreductase subunit L [Pontibacillus sp. HMF3514]QHE53786.1 NADH-quinone oxidoreductase subunit L [Pontibacillus sp. HMF3514]
MLEYAWIMPVFPLLSFVLLIILRQTVKDKSSYIGIGLSGVSLILSGVVLMEQLSQGNFSKSVGWLSIGDIELTVGYIVNPLNAMMLVLVSLVSFLVHIYSMGYMKEDSRLNVFYAYLGLFTFAMLALVLSPNLLQIYMFWELVGLGSFLLIGFYFYKKEARQAAKKAFIMTRIGDIGLLIGLILLFWQTGSLELTSIFEAVEAGAMEEGMITLIAILIFVGAIGKSGQFPLHSWLPDAMEGPTPVSALIHAATMVAAGVYLVATLFPLYEASETAMIVVATIGAFTAIFAATIALVQKDLKRVLAYSTVSQLGYMMLALGSAGYVAGVFHLMTHAFFKALLFLAAGSVIHAVHTQNIEKMGGLWRKMKWTGPLFLIGALAISGFPLLSGFFSKEEILLAAWGEGHYVLFTLALIAAFLTAFYMFRLFFMVFTSPAKTNNAVKESPKSMTFPMIVLGALAVVAGYINTPWFGTFLGDWLTAGNEFVNAHHAEGPIWIMLVTILLSLGGIYLAYVIYHKKTLERDFLSSAFPITYTVMYNRYFVDEFYQMTVGYGARALGYLGVFIEKYIVNVIASLCSNIVHEIGKQGSKLQNGQVQTYGAVVFVGLVIILAVAVMQGGMFQ